MKVHIGCGLRRIEGWVNVDYHPTEATDMVFDLQEEWPIKPNQVEAIYGCHVLEHLSRPLDFFRAAWTALRPNGTMDLHFPYGGHRSAWWDHTHVRPWFSENFGFLQPGYDAVTGNPQHLAWTATYGIQATYLRVGRDLAHTMADSWWRRRYLQPWLPRLVDAIEELFVHLYALKTPDAVEEYRLARPANSVPQQYVVWRHDWERRTLRHGEDIDLVPLPGAPPWSWRYLAYGGGPQE